ncbi:MAG TPA: hypothetical protein VG694_00275 [Candidatus Paceibacterota bacterium]|nr:hypothetical protein [Candidatus Paceibacterota bacterium]
MNRAPKDESGGKPKMELGSYAELVETQPDFWYAFLDSKGQFTTILNAVGSGKSIEELKALNAEVPYMHFREYLKSRGQTLSDNLLEKDNYVDLISVHDELIDRIKNFHTEHELKHILGEMNDLFQMYDLER